MNVARLEHLVHILSNIPATDRLDMGLWRVEHICETVACALGWAGVDPQFNEEGFTLSPPLFTPVFGEHWGFDAASRFFDITMDQARHLFSGTSYGPSEDTDPRAVIERIRTLISARNPTP